MATFDQLSAEQRAIIELILKQGQSYDGIGDALGLPAARVRELARDALVSLSPISAAAVDADWRNQVADYLLGQQSGPESTATRGHLRRSEAARGWSRSVLDSLDQFYDRSNIPTIPEGEPHAEGRRERPPRAAREPRERKPANPATKRHRALIAAAAALAVIALVAVLVWPIGLVTDSGGGGGAKASSGQRASNAQPKIVAQLVLRPVGGAQGAGIAVIAQRGNTKTLIVQARLTPNKNREAYEVWLYNSRRDARSIGAQVTDAQGTFQGAKTLPADYRKFKYIDISREKVNSDRSHSGNSVLRGAIADFVTPQPQSATNTTPGTGTATAP